MGVCVCDIAQFEGGVCETTVEVLGLPCEDGDGGGGGGGGGGDEEVSVEGVVVAIWSKRERDLKIR